MILLQGSFSENGRRLELPYTDEDDPRINCFTPKPTDNFKRFTVPLTLTLAYSNGFLIEDLTPAFAARCMIFSGLSFLKIVLRVAKSRTSSLYSLKFS